VQRGPDAPAVAGGLAPDARRCTAHNRRGERCARWAAPGKGVCHYHGARSTGPRTPAGRLRNVAAKLRHGARATSATYEGALHSAHPDLFDTAGGAPGSARSPRTRTPPPRSRRGPARHGPAPRGSPGRSRASRHVDCAAAAVQAHPGGRRRARARRGGRGVGGRPRGSPGPPRIRGRRRDRALPAERVGQPARGARAAARRLVTAAPGGGSGSHPARLLARARG